RRTIRRTITEMNVWAETLRSETRIHHGRGAGVGRERGVGVTRGVELGVGVAVGVALGVVVAVAVGVGVAVGVAVAVAVAVPVAVGVGEDVGVGVGPPAAAQYLPPVFKTWFELRTYPPQTIISLPVHNAV